MGILSTIRNTFRRKGLPTPEGPVTQLNREETRAILQGHFSVSTFKGAGSSSSRGKRGMLSAFKAVPRLRGVEGRIARSVAAVEWKLYRVKTGRTGERAYSNFQAAELQGRSRSEMIRQGVGEKEIEQVFNHPLLDLLERPNSIMTGNEFRQLYQQYIDLTGDAFWWKKRDRAGDVAQLWPIPPTWVHDTPRFLSFEEGFTGKFRFNFWDGQQHLCEADEMLWIRDLDPENPYGRGSGEMASLSDELDADQFAAETVCYRFENHGMPDYVVVAKGANEKDIKLMEQRWLEKSRGTRGVGRVHFTSSDAKVESFSPNLVDLGVLEQRKYFADEIRETPGVPPEVMGQVENSNRATIDASQFMMASNVVTPRCWKLEGVYNNELLWEEFGEESMVMLFDSPIPEDRERQLSAMVARPETVSVNEWRKAQGLAPKLGGDDLYVADQGTVLVSLEQMKQNQIQNDPQGLPQKSTPVPELPLTIVKGT